MTTQMTDAPVATAGLFLRMAREHAGLTQGELAAQLGVDTATVVRAEKGLTSRLRLERIRAWEDACGVRRGWLQWNIDALEQPDMQFDLRPGQAGGRDSYTPSDSNREPADLKHEWVLAA